MNYLIKYELRLGDIIRMFPACKYLSDQSHKVYFYTYPEYKTILDLVSYAEWVPSPSSIPWDRFLDPQIFPDRYRHYRESKVRWKDYVYSLYPEFQPAVDHPIIFDRPIDRTALEQYQLPDDYVLISPFGHSQEFRPSVPWFLRKVRECLGHTRNVFMLSETPLANSEIPTVTASHLSHLVPLIANAREFFTINSSPSIIASAVRRKYYHIYCPDHDGLEDHSSPNQVVLRQDT